VYGTAGGGATVREAFSYQFSVFSCQFSVVSFQFSVFSFQFSVFSFQFSVFSFQLLVVRHWGLARNTLCGAGVGAAISSCYP
jgi:hypothetical protein